MTANEMKYVNELIIESLQSISPDYRGYIANAILSDVCEDIEASAGPEWNSDDLALALGRVLCNRLGIQF